MFLHCFLRQLLSICFANGIQAVLACGWLLCLVAPAEIPDDAKKPLAAEKACLSIANGSFDERWLQTCGIKHIDTIPLGPIKEYLIFASALIERRKVDEALQLLEQLYLLVDQADRTWDKAKVTITASNYGRNG